MAKSVALAFVLALPSAAPASATQTELSEEEILVTGETPREAQRQAVAYVKELGVATGEKPTARWFSPICPRAVGLDQAKTALVESAVRDIARRAGAPLAKEGCKGNLIVAFTDDGAGLARQIASKSALGTAHPTVARELRQGAAPVRWWYNISARPKDAGGTSPDVPPGMEIDVGGTKAQVPNGAQMAAVSNSSHISTQIVQSIDSATVIVDVRLAEGAKLKAVSDYAALVSLAEVKLGAAPPKSVLGLFTQDRSLAGLTPRDEAFLGALYRVSMDRRSDQQRRSIVANMVRSKEKSASN